MFLDRLRGLRADKKYTQADVAKILKISREAYSLYESGKRQMNPESLCILADLYAVSVDFLLGRKDVDTESLKDDEIEIIKLYRTLDERGQETIKANLEFESEQTSKPRNPNGKAI